MATEQVWAVGMFRDEGDVAYDVLDHLADEGVDGILVADNRSSDATRAELERAAADLWCPVVIVDDPEVGYYQSRKMSALAERAAVEHGASWIVPFDADEVWYAHSDRLASALRASDADIVQAYMLNHFATALDLDDPAPFRSMTYRQTEPNPLLKVAFRWQPGAVIHQGNHGVTLPTPHRGTAAGDVGIRHFPYRSVEHFRRKATNGLEAYRATDLPPSEGAHWRQYGELLERFGPDALDEVFRTWFWFLAPCNAGMVLDPAPFLRWR